MEDDPIDTGQQLATIPSDTDIQPLDTSHFNVDTLEQALINRSPTEREHLLNDYAELYDRVQDKLGEAAYRLIELRDQYMPNTVSRDSEDAWMRVQTDARAHGDKRNRVAEARDRANKVLSPEVIEAIFSRIDMGGASASQKFSKWMTTLQQENRTHDVDYVNLRLSHAVFRRMERGGTHKTLGLALRPTDFDYLSQQDGVKHYTPEEIGAKKYYLDENNVIQYLHAPFQGRVLGTIEPTPAPTLTTGTGSAIPMQPPTGRVTRYQARVWEQQQQTMQPPPDATQSTPDTTQPPPSTTEPPPSTTEPPPATTEPPPATTQPVPDTVQPTEGGDDGDTDDAGVQPGDNDNDDDAQTVTDTGTGADVDDGDADDSSHGQTKKSKKKTKKTGTRKTCKCPAAIPAKFLNSFKNIKVSDTVNQAKAAVEWSTHTQSYGNICYKHLMELLGAIGFQTKSLNAESGVERMQAYFNAVQNSSLGDLKTDGQTYRWFRKAFRPWRESDKLGTLNYAPNLLEPPILTRDQQLQLRKELGIDSDAWEKNGSINIMCFDWWTGLTYSQAGGNVSLFGQNSIIMGDKNLMSVFHEEFDMYRHHLRQVNGSPDLGWGRNQYFSLAQQAMRQDPMYWLLYCALRPDGDTSLVSYPYYVKNAQPGNSTFFRHIDLNVDDLALKGRGASQIQGTVSLDDELPDNCTDIIPGMHHHIEEWAQDLKKRGLSNKCFVQRIENKHFTKKDETKYGTKWTAVPCKAGEVRITVPHLPHGSMGPAKTVRRTMLPWFVAVNADNNLEVIESGTFNDIAEAHRDMMPARNSPSGLPNRYGTILIPFPAAVHLSGQGLISDSLVARVPPTNQALIRLKQRLLFEPEYRAQYLRAWRMKAMRAIFDCYYAPNTGVIALEKAAFGNDKSYYYRKENAISAPLEADPEREGDDDDDGEANQVVDAHGNEGGETGFIEETMLSVSGPSGGEEVSGEEEVEGVIGGDDVEESDEEAEE